MKISVLCVIVAACLVSGCGPSPIAPASDRTAVSNSNHPPGQHPSGNPAQAPGCSNPNTVPSSDCKK